MPLIGDRYDLGVSIGTGGMSDVYAATDTLLGREIAIKMLKVDLARDENFRERFRREAQNSARLNHPNIVAVYDTGSCVIDGVDVPYIVMERVIGRNLRDIMREDGVLPPERAAALLTPVTAALQASHDAGIIHRDVKPANIMVTNTGEVKVMDFGIARAMDDSTSAMTQTSAVIGTAQYLSPEQARGKTADFRSDVYALGCVLYESVTGKPPFEGETPFAVAYQHVQEDPEEPSSYISGLSPQEAVNIDAVTLTAMAKHPADRYQTAAEMGEDLKRLSRGAVTQAARSHVATPSQEQTVVSGRAVPAPAPVATTAIPAAAGAGAGAMAGAGAGADPAPRESRYAQHRENTKPQNGWLKWLAGLLALVALGFVGAFMFDYFRTEDSPETITETMITLPDVAGQERNAAQQQLEDLGLQVEIVEEPSPDVPRNNVIRMNPEAGSHLREGTTVNLTVSSGPEMTDVPDVSGKSPQEAVQILSGAGLELNSEFDEEESDTVESGLIIRQNPPAGTQLSKGSKISIVVSAGKEKVRIPSLIGMDADAASETLSSLGLEAQFEQVDSSKPEGEVIAVAGSGTEVDKGSTVAIQISNGMIIEMIDITRKTPEEARTALEESGWSGTLTEGPAAATGALIDEGLIAATQPKEGDEIRKDADITINVWKFDATKLLPTGQPGPPERPDRIDNQAPGIPDI
ncbi:Stk1 family PASTA domain-containing Ser/Thr kinase [Corynebacterium breve]|uniref:non-specific serine/threonine protein kinase n=1 Tax=Corynebacterium breve TaxID=3049799 RepID=A0ABY8VHJ0_9CORY|nr:Stk1 family PASTA domain-containing Ser/Thr kinase [Corynebacterium breve]WIM67728.1 Stk1 family PASTA domain-containing Ser/Thr kinase [Corynebacterium breve]